MSNELVAALWTRYQMLLHDAVLVRWDDLDVLDQDAFAIVLKDALRLATAAATPTRTLT